MRRLQALSIEAVANGTQGFVAPPTGDLVLGDVPFRLTERIFQSQAEPAPHNTYPTRARLDVNVPQAEQLYLLLTTGNGFLDFAGSTIGRVVVECDGASSVLRELTLGQNVREWHSEPNVVASAPQAQQVWEGEIAGAGVLGHIDMLSLELPPACRSGALTAVEVLDESVAGTGSLDPALNLTGVSVAYYE